MFSLGQVGAARLELRRTLALTAVKNCDRGRAPDDSRIGVKAAMVNIRSWDSSFCFPSLVMSCGNAAHLQFFVTAVAHRISWSCRNAIVPLLRHIYDFIYFHHPGTKITTLFGSTIRCRGWPVGLTVRGSDVRTQVRAMSHMQICPTPSNLSSPCRYLLPPHCFLSLKPENPRSNSAEPAKCRRSETTW